MKFYSEELNKLFDTQEELDKAEKEYKGKIIQKETKRKEIELKISELEKQKENLINIINNKETALNKVNQELYNLHKELDQSYTGTTSYKELEKLISDLFGI